MTPTRTVFGSLGRTVVLSSGTDDGHCELTRKVQFKFYPTESAIQKLPSLRACRRRNALPPSSDWWEHTCLSTLALGGAGR